MRVLFFFAALAFAIVGMSGVTLSLLNLIDDTQTGGWPLWQSLPLAILGVAGFLFCLVKVIRGVHEEVPRTPE
jgi:TRAP-type C4-dicarboxylate transport system permease small subunit